MDTAAAPAPPPMPDIDPPPARAAADLLRAAGFDAGIVAAWEGAAPPEAGVYGRDVEVFGRFWSLSRDLVKRLPRKPARDPASAAAAEAVKRDARAARLRFLDAHAARLYAALTDGRRRFVRIETMALDAACAVPGLVPTAAEIAAESGLLQADKDGVEIDQGLMFNRLLALPEEGRHLCHAMLLPRAGSREALARFRREGALDLGTARLSRRGKAAVLTLDNARYLNAEDDSTLDAMETATDVCILDPDSQVAVLRGSEMPSGKYAGRRVFNAGINLTHIYHGKIPLLWYLRRDLGFVNKFARGVAVPDAPPDEVAGDSIEKLWVAAVETFAIGGGCQILLACDFNVAEQGVYMTLPARKEGIIPAMANLRLPRFVGDRLARQAIMYERRIEADSEVGRMIVDEIAPVGALEATLDAVVERLTGSGTVSAAANRRAFRVGLEPLDTFRRYAAVYAREQAWCHFSPALIANLEMHWNAQNRRA